MEIWWERGMTAQCVIIVGADGGLELETPQFVRSWKESRAQKVY